MGSVEVQESKYATSGSAPLPSSPSVEDHMWAIADSPHTVLSERSLCVVTTSSCQNLELSTSQMPAPHQSVAELMIPDAIALHQSPSVSDQITTLHVPNMCTMGCACSPLLGSPVAHDSKMHAVYANGHVPLSESSPRMVGPSLLESSSLHAAPQSSSTILSSGNDVVAPVSLPSPSSSLSKASPSRFEFLQSFVNTLLPELKRIHTQGSSISLQEKYSAVRLAADMSLAISAGGDNAWSQALFQDMSNSYSNKAGMKKSSATRVSNKLRSKIYSSILRRNTRFRVKHSHAIFMRACSPARNGEGTVLHTLASISRDCYHAFGNTSANPFHASHSGGSSQCRKSFHVRRMRRVASKRRFSHVKALRNSRSAVKMSCVKPPADQGCKACNAHALSVSKEHIASLSRLVPGGHTMDVPLLFQEAADYILSLQMQVEALQSLSRSVFL